MSLHWQLPPTLPLSFCQSRRAQALSKNTVYLRSNTSSGTILMFRHPSAHRTNTTAELEPKKCAKHTLLRSAVVPEEERWWLWIVPCAAKREEIYFLRPSHSVWSSTHTHTYKGTCPVITATWHLDRRPRTETDTHIHTLRQNFGRWKAAGPHAPHTLSVIRWHWLH